MKSTVKPFSTDASLHGDVAFSILVAAFDDANSGVALFDAAGTLRYLNPEMQRLSGTGTHPLATLADLAPDDRTGRPSIEFERFRAGRSDHFRSRLQLRRADGSLYWADVSARRRRFESGNLVLSIVEVIDVTAEVEARAALERDLTRWETALEAGCQGVWEHDARKGTVTYSRMWRRLRGIPDDEVVDGRRDLWLARLHPEDRERIESVVEKQETGKDGFDTLEYRERHRDGHYVWILSRGKPIEWDENGNPVRSIGTDTDISRLKAIEAELALEKERLQVTLQSIADGVISTDAHGRITFINAAAERMTGWPVGDALGQPIEIVYDGRIESELDTPTASVAHCLRHGRIFRANGYSMLKGKRARALYVREIASPLRTASGDVIGAVMVFRDATQRRKLMLELEYSASHDALTGLDNRAAFEDHLDASVKRANAGTGQDALCLLDLDRFKAVNDSAGHSAGDALLKEIARLIEKSCRDTDCVARLGGDEFGVILRDCNLKTARKTAQKIISRISALRFTWLGDTFRVGASVGLTAIDGSVSNASELYRNADNACYAAKRNGRGCIVVFS